MTEDATMLIDAETVDDAASGFLVTLPNFNGPFDLLLSLIARRRMDVTEIALAEVTDEFLSYVRTLETTEAALDQSSSFVVVAATLLDLKTARLLPSGFSDPEEELALLEAKDLLFARLLQYKAFKEAAGLMRTRMEIESARTPRQASIDPQLLSVLPELVWTLSAEQFGQLAHEVLNRPVEPAETVGVDHLHAPAVSVQEQTTIMAQRLSTAGVLSFGELIADAASSLVVVARFLGLLEMFRDRLIQLDQPTPLGEITVEWAAIS
ncbi:segregation and condensation protein A [Citricoccus sp. NR2]|uniref:segregation and condensation protein A n=1 Tax=Citricoccus sp. NR2 TaxID=3004095 RepID=UPI0022DE3BDE|nr:ScpA family protein [Citricoccus sp. NR2]WBL18038.1 ScpA family protein [Citricoccus sp. NR2]